MDTKTLATILFRAFGVSYLLFGICYAPYLLLTAAYSGSFIIYILLILTYLVSGACLILFSSFLAGLVIKGLQQNSTPPLPPTFEN